MNAKDINPSNIIDRYLIRSFYNFDDKGEDQSIKFKTIFFLIFSLLILIQTILISVLQKNMSLINENLIFIFIVSSMFIFFLYILSRTKFYQTTSLLFVIFNLIFNLITFENIETYHHIVFLFAGTVNMITIIFLSLFDKDMTILVLSIISILLTYLYLPITRTDFPADILIGTISFIILVTFLAFIYYFYSLKQGKTILTLIQKFEEEKIKVNEENESKTKFIANTSHEIRNQLQIIKGYLTLLNESEEYDAQFVSRIDSSTSNILRLLDDFLDIRLIELGKVTLSYKPENIKVKLKEIFDFFLIQFERKNLACELIIDDSIPDSLMVDIYRLNQIIINLIQNAIKYTFQGFVKVKLVLKHETDIRSTILYEFQDSGIGIKEEEKSKIFKSFSRASNGDNKGIKGIGLGLNIVYDLVSIFKGKIWFESHYNVGTRFFVELNLLKNNKN